MTKLSETDQLYKIFTAVVSNSSYGSSEVGGPVWIMDFREQNIKKHLAKAENIELLYINSIILGIKLENLAKDYIEALGLSNVIVVTEKGSKERILYFGPINFCMVLCKYLRRGTLVEFSLDLHDITRPSGKLLNQSGLLAYVCFEINRNDPADIFPSKENCGSSSDGIIGIFCPKENQYAFFLPYISPYINEKYNSKAEQHNFVLPIVGWENYLPLLIYDLMEYIAETKDAYEHYWYPELQYDERMIDCYKGYIQTREMALKVLKNLKDMKNQDYGHRMKLIKQFELPQVHNQKVWHKDFFPKKYWSFQERLT